MRYRFGDYRIIYQIIDSEITIVVVKISHRKDLYRSLWKLSNLQIMNQTAFDFSMLTTSHERQVIPSQKLSQLPTTRTKVQTQLKLQR